MDYILVVPSHRRPATFYKKTYNFLQKSGAIKPVIWVNDEKDLKDYSELNLELEIIIGGSSISEKRNMIQAHYAEGTKIVMIDDDIKNVVVYDDEEPKGKRNVTNFNELVKCGFDNCEKFSTTMWGVYPVDNPLFLKPSIRTNLCYIVGALFGIINRKHDKWLVKYNYAEDFERSMRYYYEENRLLRLEFIGLSTNYYKEKGGLQTTRTEEKNFESKYKLVQEFPVYLKMIEKRGRAEIGFIKSKGVLHNVEVSSII